jgi:hypothetical protein
VTRSMLIQSCMPRFPATPNQAADAVVSNGSAFRRPFGLGTAAIFMGASIVDSGGPWYPSATRSAAMPKPVTSNGKLSAPRRPTMPFAPFGLLYSFDQEQKP